MGEMAVDFLVIPVQKNIHLEKKRGLWKGVPFFQEPVNRVRKEQTVINRDDGIGAFADESDAAVLFQ